MKFFPNNMDKMDYKNLISKGKILKVIIFPDFWIEEATEQLIT